MNAHRRQIIQTSLLIGLALAMLLVPVFSLWRADAAITQPPPGVGQSTGPAAILNNYDAYFMEAASTFGLAANFIKAIATVEEGWYGDSSTGAVGIMQIMPDDWGDIARWQGYNIYTPRGNIMMGAYILSYNYRTYGSYREAARHYIGIGTDPSTGTTSDQYWDAVNARWNDLDASANSRSLGVVTPTPARTPAPPPPGTIDPARARDGNMKTSWYARGPNGYPASASVQFDLGVVQRLSSVRWAFASTGAADQFRVAVSAGKGIWSTLGAFGNAPAAQWQWATVNQSARYVRFQFDNPNNDRTLGYLAEVEVYGVAAPTPIATATQKATVPATATARATATATATTVPVITGSPLRIVGSIGSNGITASARARDGDLKTDYRGSAAAAQASVIFDLGSSGTITTAQWWATLPQTATSYSIDVSVDKSTWTPLAGQTATVANAWLTLAANATGRYVRFSYDNPGGAAYLGGLAEVKFYGGVRTASVTTVTTATPTPTPRATVTLSPVATTTTTAIATAATATPLATTTTTTTATPTSALTPTEAATSNPTDTPAPTETATAVPTETATPTDTVVPTETATPTDTVIPTETATPTETETPTETPTVSAPAETAGAVPPA